MGPRPALHMPVRDVEGLLGQDEMPWVVEGGIGVVEYMQVLTEIRNFPTTTVYHKSVAFYIKMVVGKYSQIYEGSPSGSLMRRLADRATIFSPTDMWQAGCFSTTAKEAGTSAAICDVYSVMAFVSEDFGDSGKCNYYLAEDTFYSNSIAMAFQVSSHPC